MTRSLSITLCICAASLTAALLSFGWFLYPHLTGTLDAWKASAPNVQPTLDAISGPRGTLWQVNKAVVKMGDAVVTTQIQEREIIRHSTAAIDTLKESSAKLGNSAQALTETLGEGKRTIQAAQPLLASLTRTSDASTLAVQHFDALIQSKDLADAISNTQATTQNIAGITLDLRKVSDKTTADYLKPKTPWQKVGGAIWDAYSIAGWAARH